MDWRQLFLSRDVGIFLRFPASNLVEFGRFYSGQGQRGHIERSMGPEQHADVGNSRLDLQRGRLHRDHADDLEAAQRPRSKLEARLQSSRSAGVFDQDWIWKGEIWFTLGSYPSAKWMVLYISVDNLGICTPMGDFWSGAEYSGGGGCGPWLQSRAWALQAAYLAALQAHHDPIKEVGLEGLKAGCSRGPIRLVVASS